MVYSVSTLSSSLRLTDYLIDHRARLDKAVIENASEKHADIGLALGSQTGLTTSFRTEHSQLVSQLDTNHQLVARLDVMETALDNVHTNGSEFRSNLIALKQNSESLKTASGLARTELGKLTNALNSNVGGVYVFGGVNTGTSPVRNFEYESDPADPTDPLGPEEAIKDAFNTHFGLTIGLDTDEAAIEALSAADWEAFLDSSDFNDIFDADWSPTWSSATDPDEKMTATIGNGVTTVGSGSANEEAFKSMAKGYSMIAVFGGLDIQKDAEALIADRAIDNLNQATGKVIDLEANTGAIKANVERTNTDIEAKRDVLNLRINDLENVDPNRAAVELSMAQTQLETTYAITAKIQNLNIMKYL
ncbi:Putative flagellar hook-associated 3 [Pseudovibrio sp. FO-BEG1]|uniref:flagellar hook-associated family protein n=1 Tax=Pseudovibrio sp. (strain FO-BEG1) TaxID=911045 RepID=UPI000238BF64|nr:flagellar hook-associated family protein [Pseudovibrio sp. FO-BEG1]AEV37131.1 Putative flagellar hook-associated 3 [Pseudovibrio sp. FO-BEG1]